MPTPAPVAPKKFPANQGENTLSKRLEKILPLTQDFDCLVGYFFISGLEGNLEFNVLLAEPEEHDYALHRFNELWADAVDVKDVHETIITTMEKESPFAFFTPYELYLKFLADYFRDDLGDRSKLNTENLPQNFKKRQLLNRGRLSAFIPNCSSEWIRFSTTRNMAVRG